MRSQKSCNKLKTSFLELLSQSDGLPIRMTELLKLAGVSKTTFYVYYENLDQLAFYLIDEQLRELNAVLRLRRKNGEGESDYVVLTQWIEQHWELLLLLNRSKYRSYLEQSLFQFLSEELIQRQRLLNGDLESDSEQNSFLAYGYLGSLFSGLEENDVSKIAGYSAVLQKMIQLLPTKPQATDGLFFPFRPITQRS